MLKCKRRQGLGNGIRWDWCLIKDLKLGHLNFARFKNDFGVFHLVKVNRSVRIESLSSAHIKKLTLGVGVFTTQTTRWQ